jgi:hypothetical protein
MQMRITAVIGASIAALAACGTTLPGEDSLVVDVKVATAVTAGALPFTFSNESSVTVTTGALDCTVSYERREGATWVRHDPLRQCIAIAVGHPPGSSTAHQTVAPDEGGTWRLVVEAWTGGGVVTTRSQPFTVTDQD